MFGKAARRHSSLQWIRVAGIWRRTANQLRVAMRDENPNRSRYRRRSYKSQLRIPLRRARSMAVAGRLRGSKFAHFCFSEPKKYMIRQVLGVMHRPPSGEFGWNEIDYGNWFAFQAADVWFLVAAAAPS